MNNTSARESIRHGARQHSLTDSGFKPRGRRAAVRGAGAALATVLAMLTTLTMSNAAAVATPPPAPTVTSTFPGSAATVQLANGTQLVVGGCGLNHCSTVLTTAVIYNPTTKTSTPTGSTLTPHASATATLLRSGQVLLAGGCMGRLCGKDNPASELWNPTTGRWTATADMLPTPTYGLTPRNASAVLLASGRVLVAGGTNYEATAQTYYPATGTWTMTKAMRAPRESFTLITLQSGKVLAAGGCDDYYCQSILRSAELYDPATGVWAATGNMTQARYYHSATLFSTGQVRVTGGSSGTAATPDELYTPSSGTWARS